MQIIVTRDYAEMSKTAADIIIATVKNKPDAVLGLATGSTPLGLYELMIKDHRENGTSYKHITTFNLDEYDGLSAEHEQSYAYFMRKNLFNHIDINLRNTHIENGLAPDRGRECLRYNRLLKARQQDIQLLGLGSNGHIAFNEPGTPFNLGVHVVRLTESTITDNSRLFESRDEVPQCALTMGPKNIMAAKRILILASGKNKAQAVYNAVRGEVSVSCPASVLRLHGDCTMIIDREAASLL